MSNVRRESAPELAVFADSPPPIVTRWDALCEGSARDALGILAPGGRIFVLSKGAQSVGDVLQWALEQTGPVDVLISTWTISPDEIKVLRRLVDTRVIRSLRLLVDFSFRHRHPAYCAELRATFGPECVALTVCHAKLAVLTNEQWSVVIRSSANLNRNYRCEYHEVSDEPALAQYVAAVLGEWFPPKADQWDVPAIEHKRRFDAWHGQAVQREAHAAPAGVQPGGRAQRALRPASEADAAFFGDGWADTDIRRAGITFSR